MTTFADISESGFTLTAAGGTHWEIALHEACSNDLVHRIVRTTRHLFQAHGKPSGILIDLTQSNPVSLVCISNMVDTLSRNKIMITAVFNNDEQHALAQLIHYTLPYREYVQYFTERQQAVDFLNPQTTSPEDDDG